MQKSYQESIELLFNFYAVDPKKGLSNIESEKRIATYGYNELPDTSKRTIFSIFLSQFQNALIYILLASALLIFIFAQKKMDAFIVSVVVFFNAILGTIQEAKTEKIIESLKQLMQGDCVVLRDGKKVILEERKLVPGDIILVRQGERIPADCRIIISNGLCVDESILTGEAKPVLKIEETILQEAPLYEQKNMLFKGTYIFAGNGQALVIKTGKNTEIGKIQKTITEIKTEIPLKKELNRLSSILLFFVAAVCILLLMVGIYTQRPFHELISMLIALFICIIPEGLPVVLTVILTTGARTLSKNNILVRNMQAVEALGRVNTIVIDKTGTITKNELMITDVFTKNGHYKITGSGYDVRGNIQIQGTKNNVSSNESLHKMGIISQLLNTSEIIKNTTTPGFVIKGDPTEAALSIFGQKMNIQASELTLYKKIAEIPFRPELLFHAGLFKKENQYESYIIGSPEIVFQKSRNIDAAFNEVLPELLRSGFRVLAFGYKIVEKPLLTDHDTDFILLGICVIEDAIREEIPSIAEEARAAGLHIIMATGDHALTAVSIAKRAHIFKKDDMAVDGSEFVKMTDEDLLKNIHKITVFSRMIPEYKVRIIKILHEKKEIVAMTGDGVNDAPSLVAADIGISLGQTGTEVAKQASDLLLLHDSFEYIVKAIEEGRHIFQTLKRIILYFFATNLGELLVVFFAFIISIWLKNPLPLPITAAQILWLNLITDGFLDVGLTFEKKEQDLLNPVWLKERGHLLDISTGFLIVYMATIMAIGSLFLFYVYQKIDLHYAQTVTLITMAMFQWFNAWNCRSIKKSLFSIGFFSNKILIGITVFVLCLQLLVIHIPFLQYIFDTMPLSLNDWLIITSMASSIIIFDELRKIFFIMFQKYFYLY